MDLIALLIFDECHHAQAQKRHPYAQIMKVIARDAISMLVLSSARISRNLHSGHWTSSCTCASLILDFGWISLDDMKCLATADRILIVTCQKKGGKKETSGLDIFGTKHVVG